MTRRIVALAAVLSALTSCAPDPIYAARDLPALLRAWHERSGSAGVAMAVAAPGQQRWVGAQGLADRDTGAPLQVDDQFRIGSVTKTFTAVVTLQLAEQSRLSLDDPVSRYVSG